MPENVTFDPSVTNPFTATKINIGYFETFFGDIGPLKLLLQDTILFPEILGFHVT